MRLSTEDEKKKHFTRQNTNEANLKRGSVSEAALVTLRAVPMERATASLTAFESELESAISKDRTAGQLLVESLVQLSGQPMATGTVMNSALAMGGDLASVSE